MKKLNFVTLAISSVIIVSTLLGGCKGVAPAPNTSPEPSLKQIQTGDNRNLLFIPPILEDRDPDPSTSSIELIAQKSTKKFIEGKITETYGYNGG